MTVFGTPYGTILNTTGFQGTQPGNAVQATVPGVTPGVGLFPPNSNSQSGATALSEQAKGNLIANALVTNLGTADSRPGRSLLETEGMGQAKGTNSKLVSTFGASLNDDIGGGAGPGAGGLNQTPDPGCGESTIGVHNGYANQFTATTQYQG
jgi:hypothetical protein